MKKIAWLLLFTLTLVTAPAHSKEWKFAVSGDSRDCGDVIMPVIAAHVVASPAQFYWHLGDYRKIYDFDTDMQHQPEHGAKPLSILDYENTAWEDFIDNQLGGFGSLPVYLGIGNHETTPPKTREDFVGQFADWLGAPSLRAARLQDDAHDHRLRTYYHWTRGGVDFINLDNATPDQFDKAQLKWFDKVLARDEADASIHAVVVGMHEALPHSLAGSHSMDASAQGVFSGTHVYESLLHTQNVAHKHVYLLASHAHYFMDGAFNTEYWRSHGGVLPGWIVGTGGAVRHPLPPEAATQARASQTKVYGYMLATVHDDGAIEFTFYPIVESDVPAAMVQRYGAEFVHWCFAENTGKPVSH